MFCPDFTKKYFPWSPDRELGGDVNDDETRNTNFKENDGKKRFWTAAQPQISTKQLSSSWQPSF
jgi:hypothetical protein